MTESDRQNRPQGSRESQYWDVKSVPTDPTLYRPILLCVSSVASKLQYFCPSDALMIVNEDYSLHSSW